MYKGTPGRSEDKARQRNIYAKKHLQNDLQAQKDMERAHLQTIRKEKIQLQKELERMHNKGQYMVKRHGHSNHTQRLLKLRLTSEQVQDPQGESGEQEQDNGSRLGLPEIKLPKDMKKTSNGKLTMEERVKARRRQEAEKKQEALVAKVGKLAEDFKDKNSQDLPLRRQSNVSPIQRHLTPRQDGAQTAKSDGYVTESRRLNRTKSKQNARSSIGEVDFTEAKNSVARRLLKSESVEGITGEDTNGRKISHVLPIETATKDVLSQNIEDLVFDQEIFAPDGHVRTVHLLPDPEEAYREAKKARYLRWGKGSNPMEKELTVGEIFGDERIN
ncbi:uncharacterized protein [Amphiura filiformis]|uniref:uncharacterized protein n=1 Tax=Amphiura filiformis TaxID=82378 RepID=UPI003B210D38